MLQNQELDFWHIIGLLIGHGKSVVIYTYPKPGPKLGPQEIPEIILPGRARMMVLVAITLPGRLRVELKYFFNLKAGQDHSWPGQDDGISLPGQ